MPKAKQFKWFSMIWQRNYIFMLAICGITISALSKEHCAKEEKNSEEQ